jgi:ferredoxin
MKPCNVGDDIGICCLPLPLSCCWNLKNKAALLARRSWPFSPKVSSRTAFDYATVANFQKENYMPQLKVEVNGAVKTVEAPIGKRLVNALVDEAKVDQLHACGGNAKCTTCRVHFVHGEPTKMTQAEKELLAANGLSEPGLRLSCQLLVEQDMELKIISRLAGTNRADAGKRCTDAIAPPPVWTTR